MILGNGFVVSKNIFPRKQDYYHMITMRDVSSCFCLFVSFFYHIPYVRWRVGPPVIWDKVPRRLKKVAAVSCIENDFACVYGLAEAEG